ncbi:MAG: hypothetical protein H7256_04400 [Bdellovibrio sp.]|nr:hypothetical protein [Bdellovibrio sp.]
MKKFFVITLLTSSLALAQIENPSDTQTAADSVNDPADGTLAKPTAAQKKVVPNAAKKAQAVPATKPMSGKTTTNKLAPTQAVPSVIDNDGIEPVPDQPYEIEEEKPKPKVRKEATRDNTTRKETPAAHDGHLFGFHGDINVPHILNYGLDYWHSSKYFSVALNAGGYKINNLAKSSDLPNGANFKISNQEAVLRYHPFAGSFYLGLGFGKHEVNVDANRQIQVTSPVSGTADVAINDKIKANYFLPHIGWLWKTSFGMTFGMDLGYLSPSGPSVDLTTKISNISNPLVTEDMVKSTDDYKKAYQEVVDNSEKFGKMGLPYWTVFRIGYMF